MNTRIFRNSHRYAYDWRHRRVRGEQYGRTAPQERRGFVYDGWNLLHEHQERWRSGGWTPGTDLDFFRGPDLSGTLQGTGGVGGLVAVSVEGQYCLPCYDNLGNVVAYVSESGRRHADAEVPPRYLKPGRGTASRPPCHCLDSPVLGGGRGRLPSNPKLRASA